MQYAYCSQCIWARSHRRRHCACAFYIYTLLVYINTCVQSKPSSDQRCSRNRNCETETLSKLKNSSDSKLEFRDRHQDSKICGLCQYFSNHFPHNAITTSRWCFFKFLAILLFALVVSRLQIQQTKSTLNCKNFPKQYRCSIKSLKQ